MEVRWSREAFADYMKARRTTPKLAAKIDALIESIKVTPFAGLGKPEPLKGDLRGHWSRRVNDEHRLVYRVDGKLSEGQTLSIRQCLRHY